MRLEVRSAVPDDAASIATINVASWRAAYAGLVDQSILDELNVRTRELEWRNALELQDPEDRIFLLVGDEGALGYARTAGARDEDLDPDVVAEICGLYIDPATWGRGAGRLLMNAALADLDGRGFTTVVLWVVTRNERARRFYEDMGFAPDGRADKPFF